MYKFNWGPEKSVLRYIEQTYKFLQGPELTYAELTLRGNRRIPPNCYQSVQISGIQRPQLLPMSTLTRRQPIQEPTIYAQVASHSKPIYVPPPHPYMNRPSDETTAETPLIGHDNKVIGTRSTLLKRWQALIGLSSYIHRNLRTGWFKNQCKNFKK